MDQNNQLFFKSISYTTYQKISKQTRIALYVFIIITIVLAYISIKLFYQWNTIKKEMEPQLEQKAKIAKMLSQKEDLLQKLEPLYKKNKKKVRILEKLHTMHLIIQMLFEKQESIHIKSCVIAGKKLTVIFESNNTSYREWIKKLLESKLIKNIVTTHVKKNESHLHITIDGQIIF